MGLDNKFPKDQQLTCPCCKTCKDCADFKKIIDLKDAGLVIYRHTARTEDVNKDTGLLETATNITEDVFILHNTKDVKISSADFVPALEQNKISCPRCTNIIEHAKKLLQKVPTIDKHDITGVCDHCQRKGRSHSPCYGCEEIVNKFVTKRSDKTDDTKQRVKLWLTKIKHLLQDVRTEAEDSKNLKYRTRSKMYIDRLPLDIPRPAHEPDIKQLFHSEPHRHDVIETIPKSMQNVEKIYDARSYQPYLQKLDEPIIFVDSEKHPEKYTLGHEAVPKSKQDTVNIPDEVKALFDGNDKARDKNAHPEKSRLEKELGMTKFHEYGENGQQNRWLSEISTSMLEMDAENNSQSGHVSEKAESHLRRSGKPHKGSLDEDVAAKREHIFIKSSETLDLVKKLKPSNLAKPYHDKILQQQFHHDRTQTVKAKSNAERCFESSPLTKYHSDETLLTSVVGVTEDFLKKDFRYFFPKAINENKKTKRLISSADLIKETQGMLLDRAEEQRKKFEEAHKKKLEEEEKKQIAREEKKKLAEEKKKAEDERQASEEKRKIEQEIRKTEQEISKPEEKERRKAEEDRKEVLKNKNKLEPRILKDEKNKQTENKTRIGDKRNKSFIPSATDTTIKSKSNKSNDPKFKGELKGKAGKEASKSNSTHEKHTKEKDRKGQEGKIKSFKEDKQNEKKDGDRLKQEKSGQSNTEKEFKHKETPEKLNKNEKEDNQLKKSLPEERKIPANEVISKEQTKGKDDQGDDQLKKLLAEQAKQKDEELKRKKQQEQSEKLAKEAAVRKAAKEVDGLKQSGKEGSADIKPEPEKSKPGKKSETPTIKELNIDKIKVRKASADDLILQLVKVKQSDPHTERMRPNRLSELKISPETIEEHKEHRNKKHSTCLMCIDSDLELDIESFVLKTDKVQEMADIIIGPKIYKYKPPLVQKKEEEGVIPLIFQSLFNEETPVVKDKEILATIPEEPNHKPVFPTAKSTKTNDQEAPKGIVRYALSDRTFIEKGWTLLPTEKVVRKMNVYRMRPAHPEFDWFEHNKNKRLMLYDTGEKLADFDDKGRGRWYYRNGRLALDYYDAEESNAQQRFVVYSSGEPDERGRTHPITILATFDYLGNGIVFDHAGKIRLKYNQTEGVVLDRDIGPISHWKWHTLNDPPVLQQVMIDTQMAHKDPEILKMGGTSNNKTRPDNEEMLAIEFDNFIKEKSKKLSQTFKPFQIKMKALKINENFSLKVLDQATVYLIFRDDTTNLKLNIGMLLDHKEIVDTDTAELGEVSNNMERFPARTESLAGLQRSVAYVQRFERSRTERERRLHPAQPCASADHLTTAASRPLRPPLRNVRSGSTATTQDCYCKCSRKPSSFNLYYDYRLI